MTPKTQAIYGLAIYFAMLIPLSAIFEALMIYKDLPLFWALMWMPALASAGARLWLCEGFSDVSFRIGGARGFIAILFALIFPVIIGLLAYVPAWIFGIVPFHPKPLAFDASFFGDSPSPLLVILDNIIFGATLLTFFGMATAAGEEIGWRGFMLTRLIDAGAPKPILLSGLIWGFWHVPLILGKEYLTGPPPAIEALLWMVMATSFSVVFARLRLETGSVWPAIVLHAAWNSLIQIVFNPISKGPEAALWIGEAGIFVTLAMLIAAIIVSRGKWTVRKLPE